MREQAFSAFQNLHEGEELLRGKALNMIVADERLRLHLEIVEAAMNVLDALFRWNAEDEDMGSRHESDHHVPLVRTKRDDPGSPCPTGVAFHAQTRCL